MNVLVTGRAGFIGNYLVDRSPSDGHGVTVIDNFSTGRRENLAHHAGNSSLHVVEADVADGEAFHGGGGRNATGGISSL